MREETILVYKVDSHSTATIDRVGYYLYISFILFFDIVHLHNIYFSLNLSVDTATSNDTGEKEERK